MSYRQGILDPEFLEAMAMPPAAPVDVEVRDRVRDAVEALPERERLVIEALYYERLSQRQAADRYGIARRTIVNRRDRAVRRLAEMLSE